MSKSLFQEIQEIKNTDAIYFIPGLPIVCELQLRGLRDVVSFLKKPFDEDLSSLLEKTAFRIMEAFPGCIIAHVFSNEITLVVHYSKKVPNKNAVDTAQNKNSKSHFVAKVTSLATAFFNEEKRNSKLPKEVTSQIYQFDCNCWNVYQTIMTINWLMAKETKAKHIAASKICADLGIESRDKNTKTLLESLEKEGIVFEENYKKKEFIYRGVFLKKRKLDEKTRKIERLEIPPIHTIFNKLGVFFGNEKPQLIEPNFENKKS